jgi:mannose-6-phosphate isomerase-like protein (cupin superfamily)
MIVRKSEAVHIDFDGLRILDFTSEKQGLSSSLALIEIPAGCDHTEAWSKRSDKYYLIVNGAIRFTVENREFDLNAGDFCLVRQGEKFSYINVQDSDAQLVLVHTPSFNLESEVFVDPD